MTNIENSSLMPTEVGLIPSSWKVARLRELIVMMTNGFVGLSKMHYVESEQGVTYVQGFNVKDGGFNYSGIKSVSRAFHEQHQKSRLRTGDLLTIQTGDVGLTTLVPPSLDGANCHALIITRFRRDIVLPSFYMRLFNSEAGRKSLRSIETGTTMKHLNVGDMLEFLVPVPPLAEQTAIVEALDDVSGLIDSLERLIAKKQAIMQGMMQHLLTGKTRLPALTDSLRDVPTRGGNHLMGAQSQDVTLADLEKRGSLKLYRGKVISKADANRDPGSYPVYSSSVHDGGLFVKYGKFMFDEELISWSVDGGGHFFYRPKHRFSLTNVSGYIRVFDENIVTPFLAYQLQALHARETFDYTMKAHPSVIRGLYQLWLPDRSVQSKIASMLADSDASIAALQRILAKEQAIKEGMMQELLTGRTRLIPSGETE